MYYLKTSEITWLEVKAYKLVVAFAKCLQKKKKNLPKSPVLVPIFIKPFQLLRLSAAEARISTTSTPCSYISAMLLALKSLLFFCLDIFEP